MRIAKKMTHQIITDHLRHLHNLLGKGALSEKFFMQADPADAAVYALDRKK
jgi:hypothetical protein